MGNLLDCIKEATSKRDRSPQQQQHTPRHRGFPARGAPFTPEWLPPSPVLPWLSQHVQQALSYSPHSSALESGDIKDLSKSPRPATELSSDFNIHHDTRSESGAPMCLSNAASWPPSPPSTKQPASDNMGSGNYQSELDFDMEWLAPITQCHKKEEVSTSKPKVARRLFTPKGSPAFSDFTSLDYTNSQNSGEDNVKKSSVSPDFGSDKTDTPSAVGGGVDINYANVHQLCVIGMTREQAEAVVNYRVRWHHYFQNKQELRRVPEIDDKTWSRIESRITLVPVAGLGMARKAVPSLHKSRGVVDNYTYNPSRSGEPCHTSYSGGAVIDENVSEVVTGSEDLGGNETQSVNDSDKRPSVDLNRSNYHELCVIGLSIPQAQAVVGYRFNNGPFTSKEDIKLVPGISDEAYEAVRSKVTLVSSGAASIPRSRQLNSNKKQRGKKKNFLAANSPMYQSWHSPNTTSPASDQQAIPSSARNLNLSGAGSGIIDTSPKQMYCPDVPDFKSSPRLSGSKSSRGPVRIASWNLQCFNEKKVESPGILEVVCCVILQHGYV